MNAEPENGGVIPHELRARPQWVLYRVQARNGKATKVPYQAGHAGRRASTTDPATWGTYDAAAAAHARGRGDGIGYVFAADDPFVGIDLDACYLDGVIAPEAAPIVERLHTYTEVSPSGFGLHAIGRGTVGGGRRTSSTPWGGELEVYDRDRYFTITGDHLDGTPLEVRVVDDELVLIRGELLPDEPPPAPRALPAPPALTDADLLERAMHASNGARFRALWAGDAGGYKSASEADLALASMIAFWTGPDEARIDWLFRSSGLMRPKWEEARGDSTYGLDTVRKALAGKTEFYGDRLPPALRAVTTPEDALAVASATIRMSDTPIVAAEEQAGGRLVLVRHDEHELVVPSLTTLATFAKLQAELAAAFGHELVVSRDEKTATAHRFVAALRRHLGPGRKRALEERFEGWMIELVRFAGEAWFEAGDAEGRTRVWRALDELDPEQAIGARAFAAAVLLAHDRTTGDRYLRAGWAQEYVRRCGWHGSPEAAVGALEALGLVQPNPKSGGRVRARWRAGGETITLRFWIIPAARFEAWRADE